MHTSGAADRFITECTDILIYHLQQERCRLWQETYHPCTLAFHSLFVHWEHWDSHTLLDGPEVGLEIVLVLLNLCYVICRVSGKRLKGVLHIHITITMCRFKHYYVLISRCKSTSQHKSSRRSSHSQTHSHWHTHTIHRHHILCKCPFKTIHHK